jgi:hypothetical protein
MAGLAGDIGMGFMGNALFMALMALQAIALRLLIVPILIGGGVAYQAIQLGMHRGLVFVHVNQRDETGHQPPGTMAGKAHAAILGRALGIVRCNFQMTARAGLVLFRKGCRISSVNRFGRTFIMRVMAFDAIEKAFGIVDGFTTVFGIVFDLALDIIMALQAFVAIEKIRHLFIDIGRIRMAIVHFNIAVAIETRCLGMDRLQKPVAVDSPAG